jgi:hypothetical protein
LVGEPGTPRLVTFKSKTDHTDRMVAWAGKRVKEPEKDGVEFAMLFTHRLLQRVFLVPFFTPGF